jgi:colicin import membrane protein
MLIMRRYSVAMSESPRRQIASALWLAAGGVGALYIVLVSTFDHSEDPGAARVNIFVTLLPTWPIVVVGAAAFALFVAGAILAFAPKPITPVSRPARNAHSDAEPSAVESGVATEGRTDDEHTLQRGGPADRHAADIAAPATQGMSPTAQRSAAPASSPTLGQQNALRSAKEYLRLGGFSRAGLVDQLKHEGFSDDEALVAVEEADSDWVDQAISSAERYISSGSFSRKSLVEQLRHDGFSDHDATAAVEAVGPDWNRQAALSAAAYLASSSFSRQGLFE